jgi:hypothetical protein
MRRTFIGILCGAVIGVVASIASAEDEDCNACFTSCTTARDECLQDAQKDQVQRASCSTTYAKCRKNCHLNLLCHGGRDDN